MIEGVKQRLGSVYPDIAEQHGPHIILFISHVVKIYLLYLFLIHLAALEH